MLYIGADHRGLAKKSELITLLTDGQENVKIVDVKAPDEDYNDAALAVSEQVRQNPDDKGILLCGSGHGMCMQANRLKGVRAVNAPTVESAVEAREHSDANILCLAADYLDLEQLAEIARAFIATEPLTEVRYRRRIQRLDNNIKENNNGR